MTRRELFAALIAPLVAVKAIAAQKPEPRVVKAWHHPETGEWIGLFITETMTREECARRYPGLSKQYTIQQKKEQA